MEVKTTREIIDEQFVTVEEERSLRRIKLHNLRDDINEYNLKEWVRVSQVIDKAKVEKVIKKLWILYPATQSHKGHNGALLDIKKELGL